MGNYATTAELIDRFTSARDASHLTGDADSGVPDDDVLGDAIDEAEMLVDSYASQRHLVPVAVADHAGLAAFMRGITLDIAIVYLHRRPESQVVSDEMQRAHDERLAWLKELAVGTVQLPSPDTEASTETRGPAAKWGTASDADDSGRLFTRATMGGI